MNNSLKGALLSGLLFPGLGQIVLKHYKRGAVLILTVFAGLTVFVVQAIQYARAVLEKLESEGGIIDMSAISKAATEASTASGSTILNLVLWLLILCWIIAIIDAYIIGKKMDADATS